MNPPYRSTKPTATTCEYCGSTIDPATRIDAVVPDSAYLHADDPRQDGRRLARACSPEHADELIAIGTSNWIDEQLWANKLRRVSGHWNRTETTLSGIADRAGLTPTQLMRAIRWRSGSSRKDWGWGRGGRDPCTSNSDHGHPTELP